MYFRFPGKGTPVTTDRTHASLIARTHARTHRHPCSRISSVQIPNFYWFLNFDSVSEVPNSGVMARNFGLMAAQYLLYVNVLIPSYWHDNFSKYRLVLRLLGDHERMVMLGLGRNRTPQFRATALANVLLL